MPDPPKGTNFWNPIWTGIQGWNGTALVQAEVDVTDWLTVYGGGGIFENSITSRISNPHHRERARRNHGGAVRESAEPS